MTNAHAVIKIQAKMFVKFAACCAGFENLLEFSALRHVILIFFFRDRAPECVTAGICVGVTVNRV